MLAIHPWARLAGAISMLCAVFIAGSLYYLAGVYALVVIAVLAMRAGRDHLSFVLTLTTPLLLALLLVWGVLVAPGDVPRPDFDGPTYAVFTWLRFVACGGVLQACFLPLIAKPQYLKSFFSACRLPASLSILLVAAIVFLPEVRRRLARIIDARRAQGHRLAGIEGLRELPSLIMPLVSSLLDSATRRAEFWSHRGVLTRSRALTETSQSSTLASLCWLILANVSLVVAVMGQMAHGGVA